MMGMRTTVRAGDLGTRPRRSWLIIGRTSAAVALTIVFAGSTMSVASASGHVKSGAYSGDIGPGYPLTFTVPSSLSSVEDLVVAFEQTCEPGAGTVAPKFHFKTLTITDDRFSGTSTDRFGTTASDGLLIEGTFKGDRVSGTVRSKSSIKSLGSCVQTEPYTATLKK
jgi:hypothetical protein